MANPEYRPSEVPSVSEPDKINYQAELERIEEQLVKVDENENTIERTFQREQLQEEQDAILSVIEASNQDEKLT